MAPLADQHQPAALVYHSFPNSVPDELLPSCVPDELLPSCVPDELLPSCVPANYVEAYVKLRRSFAYLASQFEPTFTRHEAQNNVTARCTLIQLSELCLTEAALDLGALKGNLIDSLTETVAKYEARRPCRTRGEQ